MQKLLRIFLIGLCFTITVSCSSKKAVSPNDDFLEDFETEINDDPLQSINQPIFYFNDWTYAWIINPISKSYRFLMPDIAETGIGNFFNNLKAPIRIVSGLLQGEGIYATEEFGEVIINSLFSLGLAKIVDKNPKDEKDIGQVLTFWGCPTGPYLVLPILGPKYPRELIGEIAGGFLSPVNVVSDGDYLLATEAGESLNEWPERYEPYEKIIDGSLDSYLGIKNAYENSRN